MIQEHERQRQIGADFDVFSYSNLYKAGKQACNGVRWKTSTINFELQIFSRTARARRKILAGTWRMMSTKQFTINERGHVRLIDAPHVNDRQIQKTFCQHVLRPAYYPHLIYDNGASTPGKGFSFAIDRIVKFIQSYYRKYGTDGYAVTLDFKKFFPTASHNTIRHYHARYISDSKLRQIADALFSNKQHQGMALGMETSQCEALMLPNQIDHVAKDKLRIRYYERYMDDIFLIVRSYFR